MRLIASVLFISIFSFSFSQSFLKTKPGQPLTFKDMQRQFNEFKKTKNLSKEKNWKYFKRWEMETQMRVTPSGEPVDGAQYMKEVLKATKEKNISALNSSAAWYPFGPNVMPANQTGYMENGIGRINCITFHPTHTGTYFIGVAQGGVWKTINNGTTWTPLTDNLPITRISDICIDPNDTNTIYISLCDFEYIGFGLFLNAKKRNTHYGLGVYKTTNGGTSWSPTGLSFNLTDGDGSLIRKIIVNPNNSNEVVACGVSGMYKSSNAGTSWNKVLDSLFWDMVQDPVNPNILYAATGWVQNSNTGSAAIYKSTNFGSTWTKLNTGIPGTGTVQRIKLAIAPSDANYIYAITVDTQFGLHGFYKSTNAGSSWQFINPSTNVLESGDGTGSGGQGTYDLALVVDKLDKNLIYSGGVNLWGSSDGAQTWNPISHWTTNYGPTVHADIHFLAQQPVTGNYFVCNDGGIYRTSNLIIGSWANANNNIPWPTQWTNLGNGLTVSSFYRVSSSKNSKGRITAGAQDNGTFYWDGTSWATIFGGDGMDNYLDPVDDSTVIGSSQYGYFDLSTDGGKTSTGLPTNPNNESAEWTTPFVADYNNYGTMYVGNENVTQSIDGGMTWNTISSIPSSGNEICALAVSNSNANVLYAAKRVRYELSVPGSVYNTTNGGSTWNDVTAGLPDSLYYTSIEINGSDENTVYISVAGFSTGNKIFKTINGGTTWQNISYNLPNLPVNCVKNLPGTKHLMAATDVGIYLLMDGTTNWINQSLGLPDVITTDIEFNMVLDKIYVSTFGRGIWATDLSLFISSSTNEMQNALTQFSLSPSPNHGTFTIELPEFANEKITLDIIDVKGGIVHSSQLTGKASKQNLNLQSGLYYARITGKNIFGVKSFVLE